MSASSPDDPRPVRPSEALPQEALEALLQARLPGFEGALRVSQLPAGHSNLTYLIEDDHRAYVLRRPPAGAPAGGHDMAREYRLLSALHPRFDRVPEPLLLCEDDTLLGGAPWYVMSHVPGVVLRGAKPRHIALEPDAMRAACDALLDTLVQIHAVPVVGTPLEALDRGEGYVRRQVEGWAKRYQRARTDQLDAVERVGAWLLDHQPPERPSALIHNDYKYDNLIYDPADLSRVRAVLDWELATVGDPLMDLGTTLGYWVDPGDAPALKAFQSGPTALPGNLTRQELIEAYGERTGQEVTHAVFYYAYGLFKICGIAQQIYARFRAGHTQDPRFGGLIHAVEAMGEAAARAIETGRVTQD